MCKLQKVQLCATKMVDPAVQRKRWYEESSSLHDYAICDTCNNRYATKHSLAKHIKVCELQQKLNCEWCNISFTNRGNLVLHTSLIHTNAKLTNNLQNPAQAPTEGIKCDVCDSTYNSKWKMFYHIRREHYNLLAKTPCCDLKKVNQIWFEKVLNTNVVMEMKKTSPNVLVMRKLGPNTAIKIHNEPDDNVTDISHLYPTSATKNRVQGKCKFCNKIVNARNLQKHIDEKHRKIAKHQCNNCQREFKRHYIFVKHVCFKGPRTRRKRTNSGNFELYPVKVLPETPMVSRNTNSKPPKKKDLRSRLLRNNLPFKSKH